MRCLSNFYNFELFSGRFLLLIFNIVIEKLYLILSFCGFKWLVLYCVDLGQNITQIHFILRSNANTIHVILQISNLLFLHMILICNNFQLWNFKLSLEILGFDCYVWLNLLYLIFYMYRFWEIVLIIHIRSLKLNICINASIILLIGHIFC